MSRRYAAGIWGPVILLLAAGVEFVVAAPSARANTITYDVQAYVDSQDQLVVQGGTVQWAHLDSGAAVGRSGGQNEPTLISSTLDGTPRMVRVNWIPDWPEAPPVEIRYPTASSVFSSLTPALPATAMTVRVEKVVARGNITLTQAPAAGNAYILIVSFDDSGPAGAAWFRARIMVEWPAEVMAIPLSCNSVRVSWLDQTTDELGFRIERSSTGCSGPWHTAGSVGAGVTAFVDPGAPTGGPLFYRVVPFTSGGDGDPTSCSTLSLPPAETFLDVPCGHWAWRYAEGIVAKGVTLGCDTTSYCPSANVTRGQMALFLGRAIGGLGDYTPSACSGERFADVSCDYLNPGNPPSAFYQGIEYIADAAHNSIGRAITLGCNDTHYCPDANVTRGQMALFLGRAVGGLDTYTPADCGSERFADVPCDYGTPGAHPSAPYTGIEYIADAAHNAIGRAITLGCDATHYCPGNPVRRDEMAAFLARAFLNMD